MKRTDCIKLAVVLCLLMSLGVVSAGISDFELAAAVMGKFTPNEPARIELTEEIVAGAKRDYSDLRVFNDANEEVPYVIYPQMEPAQTPKHFEFKVLSFKEGNPQEIVLERPDTADSFEEVEIQTPAGDFKKTVEVLTGDTLGNWSLTATDTIFDFSSKIDLRKTTVKIPKNEARYVKIRIKDDAAKQSEDGGVTLQYDGLQFSTKGLKPGPFKIRNVLGRVGELKEARFVYLERPIGEPPFKLEPDSKNAVLDLGGINLPLREIDFEVATPYYYRKVELLDSPDLNPDLKSHRVAARGAIYRFPGMNQAENTLTVPSVEGSVLKLRIINGSNPPLKVKKIRMRWPKENLYFVPEEGRAYTLYFRANFSAKPQYDLEKVIPSNYDQLMKFQDLSVDFPAKNHGYLPQMAPENKQNMERYSLIGAVLLLAVISGLWVFRLLKNVPKDS